MLSKSLLSLAIAASLVGMSGCNISSTADNDVVDNTPVESGTPEYIAENAATLGTTYPLFNPAKSTPIGLIESPVTSDILFSGTADLDGTDGTLPLGLGDAALGSAAYNPIFNAAGDMDGFSTSAQIDIPFSAALTASTVIGSGADATVFVIPLSYGTEDPLTATSTPTPGLPVAIDASVITFADTATSTDAAAGQGNILRISPTTPLNPATRYVIVLTNGIKDSNGKAVIASPTYNLLSSPTDFLTGTDAGTLAKAALQTAIQGYEALAGAIFSAAGYSYLSEDIVYSFSFTTGGTTAVLDSMAAPANFVAKAVSQAVGESFNITLPAKYRFSMEEALQANSSDDDGGIVKAVTAVLTALAVDSATGDATAKAIADGTLAALGATSEAQQASVGGLATIHKAIPSPTARVNTFSTTLPLTALGLGFGDADTRIANGTITIPQYTTELNLPADLATYTASATSAAFGFWESDDSLSTDLAAVLAAGNVPGTAVTPPSKNVTRLFPLAEVVQYVNVPLTVIYNTACAGTYTPVIYVHGITSKRSASFGVADALGAEGDNCLATVAIDLPKHGLTSDALIAALGESLESQRHYGVKRSGSSPVPMEGTTVDMLTAGQETAALAAIDAAYDPQIAAAAGDALTALQTEKATAVATATATATGTNAAIKALPNTSGDFFINLESFQSMRDNLRQSVLDILNLNASLDFMDFDGNAGMDFDTSNTKVHLIGHSLGAILSVNVAAVNNRVGSSVANCTTCNVMLPEIATVTLANPGGGVVSLLENSLAFGETIVTGIEALGTASGLDLAQGSFLYELTKNIAQATVDSGDPINFASSLAATATPVLAYQMIGDGTVDNLSDTVIPTNALPGNTVTIVDVEVEGGDDVARDYAALPAYLSGSDAVITELGLTTTSATVDGDTALNVAIKYTQGNHGSFSTPSDALFTEIMSQTASFIRSNGQDITIDSNTPVQAAQ